MKKIVLAVLGLLAVSMFLVGCAKESVELVDEGGNVVGEAMRLTTGKYQLKPSTTNVADQLSACSVMELVLSYHQTKTTSPLDMCASANKKCALGLVSEYTETPSGYFTKFIVCNQQVTAPETVTVPAGWGPASPYVKVTAVCC